jgi:hypothetical protein
VGREIRRVRCIIFYFPDVNMVASSRNPIRCQDFNVYFLVGIDINGSGILEIRRD